MLSDPHLELSMLQDREGEGQEAGYLECSACGTPEPHQPLLRPCLLWSKAHRLQERKRGKALSSAVISIRQSPPALGIFCFVDVAC